MKKTVIITGFAMMFSLSSVAYGAEGPYMSADLGLAMACDSDVTDSTVPGITIDIESEQGLGLGVAVGYGFGAARVEGEIAYQTNDLENASISGIGSVDLTGDTSSIALLLNGYYDFKNKSPFTPFVSAGIGFAKVEVNDMNVPGSGLPSTDDDDTVFAYQAGFGVGYAVNKMVSIEVKYRYLGTADPTMGTTEFEYSSHNIYAGVRRSF